MWQTEGIQEKMCSLDAPLCHIVSGWACKNRLLDVCFFSSTYELIACLPFLSPEWHTDLRLPHCLCSLHAYVIFPCARIKICFSINLLYVIGLI